MTYPTELLTFYWERLGYENQHLPTKCTNVMERSPSYPPTEYAKACRIEQTIRASTESPRDKELLD
jgi:hypothetical protein